MVPIFYATKQPTISVFFFFNDTATTEIYTLSLHDALPICEWNLRGHPKQHRIHIQPGQSERHDRSEEHTSELQSQSNLVCRLLLEKKKTNKTKLKNATKPHSVTCNLLADDAWVPT